MPGGPVFIGLQRDACILRILKALRARSMDSQGAGGEQSPTQHTDSIATNACDDLRQYSHPIPSSGTQTQNHPDDLSLTGTLYAPHKRVLKEGRGWRHLLPWGVLGPSRS